MAGILEYRRDVLITLGSSASKHLTTTRSPLSFYPANLSRQCNTRFGIGPINSITLGAVESVLRQSMDLDEISRGEGGEWAKSVIEQSLGGSCTQSG